jgi:hypothetical protein
MYQLSVNHPHLPANIREILAALLQMGCNVGQQPYVVPAEALRQQGISKNHLMAVLRTACPNTPDSEGTMPDASGHIMSMVTESRDGAEVAFRLRVSLCL